MDARFVAAVNEIAPTIGSAHATPTPRRELD
jgi:hypothetical protein